MYFMVRSLLSNQSTISDHVSRDILSTRSLYCKVGSHCEQPTAI